jgi:hypothetical protein
MKHQLCYLKRCLYTQKVHLSINTNCFIYAFFYCIERWVLCKFRFFRSISEIVIQIVWLFISITCIFFLFRLAIALPARLRLMTSDNSFGIYKQTFLICWPIHAPLYYPNYQIHESHLKPGRNSVGDNLSL